MIDTGFIMCANCKGKGHVLDGVAALFVVGIGWALAALERNTPNGLTRKECSKCGGQGYIRLNVSSC